MIDIHRVGLPVVAEAHGKKWVCLHYVSMDDGHVWYLAVEANGEASKPPPQPCFLIAVPRKKPG